MRETIYNWKAWLSGTWGSRNRNATTYETRMACFNCHARWYSRFPIGRKKWNVRCPQCGVMTTQYTTPTPEAADE